MRTNNNQHLNPLNNAAPQLNAFPHTRKPAFLHHQLLQVTRIQDSRQSPILVTWGRGVIWFANADLLPCKVLAASGLQLRISSKMETTGDVPFGAADSYSNEQAEVGLD
jgi:hypothetical protein